MMAGQFVGPCRLTARHGTTSSNPLFSSGESSANLTSSIIAWIRRSLRSCARKPLVVLTRFPQIFFRRILMGSLVIPVELGVVAFELLKHLAALFGRNGYRWHC